jgi:chitinase
MKTENKQLPRIINLLFKAICSFAALTALVILVPATAHALTPVTVAWDENNPVPEGYIIYWGTSSGNYSDSQDVGAATQYTIPDLQDGLTYYFAVKAYDDGNESDYSQEISHTVATPNSSPTTPSVPSGPASGFIQTGYSFSSTASDPENDMLQYQYDWGDGVISGWGNSTQSHTWSNTGNYCVKARARDTLGATSGWSSCGSINIGLNTHTIAASAEPHGSITPAGSVVVNNAASQSFTIAPEQDYQVLEVRVDGTLIGTATSYNFNNVTADHTITARFVYVDPNPVDSDGDGVPDTQDAFPADPDETIDTDGDGTGNNADIDDDNDGMPDAWEIANNLDPLVNDAAGDPDGDGATNFEEFEDGTGPNFYEDHSAPDAPVILTPQDNAIVPLTLELRTDEFYDPDIDDVHAGSQWQIFRASDNFCVLDVTSSASLTSLKVPKLILEEDTDYIWKVRFINSRGTGSNWSDAGFFTTDFINDDQNGNGIPDIQEVAADLDLDNDGIADSEQNDIKCVTSSGQDVQIGVSIKESENAASIMAMEIEDAGEANKITKSKGKPSSIQFGLINFKILVDFPGDETVVTIYLSRPAFDKGKLYKYDSINEEGVDYSDYAEFSNNRKEVYLTLKDGGFGDADGVENGIIVDPMTVGSETAVDDSSGSDSENFFDSIMPNAGCFISTVVPQPEGGLNIWSEIRGRELAILFVIILLGYIGRIIFNKLRDVQGAWRSS